MQADTTQQAVRQPGRRALILVVVSAIAIAAIAVTAALIWTGDDGGVAGGGTNGGGAGEPSGNLEIKPIQIESVDVRIAESYPPQLFADVTGWVGDGCTVAREPEITREGNTITVTILSERERDAICTQILMGYQKSIALGSVEPGEWTVKVNDYVQTVTVR